MSHENSDSNLWDKRFLSLADEIALWSKDTGRKVGCIVVGSYHQILSTGYNGFPRGVAEKPDRLSREDGEKYFWTEHAERNAIFNAVRSGTNLEGATIYSTLFPCADCARAIVQSGLKRLVCHRMEDAENDSFERSWKVAKQIFYETGVIVDELG